MRRSHNNRQSPCLRVDGTPKAGFPSLRQAQSHLERLDKLNRTGSPIHCYPCPKCHRWHVGKPGRRKNTERGGWK
jgi:hypothetical protein